MLEDTKHIKNIGLRLPLPDERIAKFPLSKRDNSKLLLYKHGEVGEDVFCNLPKYLPKNALMVFNNTRVIQARMHFRKETGALIEIFFNGTCTANRLRTNVPNQPTMFVALYDWKPKKVERGHTKAGIPNKRTRFSANGYRKSH